MKETYQLSLLFVDAAHSEAPITKQLKAQEKMLGFIPNMYAAMACVPMVLKGYLYTYQMFRDETQFSPIEQEVVFLTISRANNCHYCMAAHSFVADKMSGVPEEITNQIRDDEPIVDEKLAALAKFTDVLVRSQGRPSPKDAKAFLSAGYNEKHILEIITALASKIFSNYTNHLFHTPVDEVFEGRRWEES